MSRSPHSIRHLEVLDTGGRPHTFETLWQERPTLIALVRHFGCPFCHEQVSELIQLLPKLAELSIDFAVLGNGNPHHAADFARRLNLQAPIYTDPARLVYDGLGARGGVRSTIGLESIGRGIDAFRKGFRQRAVQGDRWQQGGVFVINPDGSTRFEYKSRFAGDHPSVEQLLASLEKTARR
jgi:peroxiredoxin